MSQNNKQQTIKHQRLFSLFSTLNQAQLNSKQIKEHSIVLMGLSRAGKSALLNWIFHRQSMIGKKVGTNIFYVPRDAATQNTQNNPQEALKIAKIGHGFASVTTMANMRSIKINNIQINFLDFGGFGQRRNPQEIILVNYILATFLLKMKKVKFVLVITEHAFNDISSNGLRDTLCEFVRLFDFQSMSEAQQKNFMKSISLCITSTTRQYEQSEILEQLQIIIQNFQDKSLYIQKQTKENTFIQKQTKENPFIQKQTQENNFIQKYPVCKKILMTLIKTKRFQYFPLAQVDKTPSECRIIKTFNSRQWQFFDLSSSKESICYPYVQQFYNLKDKQKQFLKQIIYSRFSLIKPINKTIKSNIQEICLNICNNNLNFSNTFQQLQYFAKKNDFYNDIKNIMPIYRHNKITLLQRFQKLQELYKICSSIQMYSNWLTEKQGRQGKFIEYNKYLNSKLDKQMDIISYLMVSSFQQVNILAQIQFIIKKSLNESMILENLNKYLQNNEIANTCRMSAYQSINFGGEFIDSLPTLKTSFINQLYSSEITIQNIKMQEVNTMVKLLCLYQQELSEMDSAKVYSICSRIKLVAAIEQFQSRFGKSVQTALKSLLQGLDFCIKQQICLEIHQNKDATEKLLNKQKDYINTIVKILLSTQDSAYINFVIQHCKLLKQYSVVSKLYSKKADSNFDLLRSWALYERQIGNGQESIRVYKKIQYLTKQSYKFNMDQIDSQSGANQLVFQKCKVEQSLIIPKDKLVILINSVKKQILSSKQTYQINFQQEDKKYRQKMKIFIINKIYQIELPRNPTNYQYLHYTNKMIASVADKKVNILLQSGPLRGQTTLAYALSNAKLIVKEDGQVRKYEHVESNSNRNNPKQYPFIRTINDDELVVDFNNIFQNQVQKKLIGAIMLQKIIQKSKACRFIFVQNEDDVLKKNGVEMINFIKLLVQCLKWDFKQRQNCQKLSNLIYLFITFVKDKPKVEKRMMQIYKQMKDNRKTIENQRIYGLTQIDQLSIYNILSPLVKLKKGFMNYPQKDVRSFQKKDWIRQIQKCSICLQPNKICEHPTWKFIQSTEFKLPISQNTFNTLLETEKNVFYEQIQNIIKNANKIFEEISRKVQENYKQSLKSETVNQSEKVLVFLYYFLQKKKFVIQDYYLPYDSEKFFNMLRNFGLLLFKCAKNCSQDRDECEEIEKRQDQLTRILYQMQSFYSSTVVDSEQFRQRISSVITLKSSIQIIFEEISKEQIFKVFLDKVNLVEIQQMKNNQKKQRLLNYYHSIIQQIKLTLDMEQIKQQYISQQQWIYIIEAAIHAKIKFLKETGRKKQAISLQISTIRQLITQKNYLKFNQSIQQADRNKLQEASNKLVEIANWLIPTHPQISKDICLKLNSKQSLDNILQKMQEKININKTQKINIMVQRIVLNNATGRMLKCNTLLKNLQVFTNRQPIGENFKNLQKTLQYAQNNKLIFQFPIIGHLKNEKIIKVVQMIQKQIS